MYWLGKTTCIGGIWWDGKSINSSSIRMTHFLILKSPGAAAPACECQGHCQKGEWVFYHVLPPNLANFPQVYFWLFGATVFRVFL
jgi:hypothetical protein